LLDGSDKEEGGIDMSDERSMSMPDDPREGSMSMDEPGQDPMWPAG
jgi:hypothetical protein